MMKDVDAGQCHILAQLSAHMSCSGQQLCIEALLDTILHQHDRNHGHSISCARCAVASLVAEWWRERRPGGAQ